MKLFLSWSQQRSHVVANALRSWLPNVLQSVEPWMSSEDLQKGARWFQEIGAELEKSDFGIICVTPENQASEWLLFEAGALSKSIDRSAVATLLLDIDSADVSGPLAQFQDTKCNKDDVHRLLATINSRLSAPLPETRLFEAFEVWWPRLEGKLAEARALIVRRHQDRPEREILEEVLAYVRSNDRVGAGPLISARNQMDVPRWFENWTRSQDAHPVAGSVTMEVVVDEKLATEVDRVITFLTCPVHRIPIKAARNPAGDGGNKVNIGACCPFAASVSWTQLREYIRR
ncbi:MAG TPA: TIR domain-containing protein [Thermoanaerobaculia bacterium]|jgi:hypothetical protein